MKITIDTDRIPLVALAAMAARYGCEVLTHGPGEAEIRETVYSGRQTRSDAFCAEQSPKVALMDEYRAHTPRCGLSILRAPGAGL